MPGSIPDAKIVPIAFKTQPRADTVGRTKENHRGGVNNRRFDKNEIGVVFRHVDYVVGGRHNENAIAIQNDFLLRGVHQCAIGPCERAQLLDGFHYLRRLLQKRAAQGSGPVKVVVHPLNYLGIIGERLDTVIPLLAVNLGGVAVCGQIAGGEHDVRRCGRGGQDQGDQGVGIERDGRGQLVQLFRGVFHRISRRRLGGQRSHQPHGKQC